jgi:hypothetical protein
MKKIVNNCCLCNKTLHKQQKLSKNDASVVVHLQDGLLLLDGGGAVQWYSLVIRPQDGLLLPGGVRAVQWGSTVVLISDPSSGWFVATGRG